MTRFTKTVLTSGLLALALAAYAATSSTNNAAANTTTNNAATNNAAVNVSPAERAKIEAVIHNYLISKPEVLMEAMQALQRKQYEEAEKTVKLTQMSVGKFTTPLFHTATDPIAGNPNGKVTVVEFFDYQCPHCVDMAPLLDALAKNPNVRIVYKEFPIRGPVSDFAARAALAANLQGKYAPVHTAILTANKQLTNDLILDLAKGAGVDIEKLKTDMNSKAIMDQVKATIKLAQDLKLFGTPAFFIGKTDTKDKITYIPGQLNQAQIDKAINDANAS